jgi:hypothetical protein
MSKRIIRRSFPWSATLNILNSLTFVFIFLMMSPTQFASPGLVWLIGLAGLWELIILLRFCYAYRQNPTGWLVLLENVVIVLCVLAAIILLILSSPAVGALTNLDAVIPGILFVTGSGLRTIASWIRFVYSKCCISPVVPVAVTKEQPSAATLKQIFTLLVLSGLNLAAGAIMIGKLTEYSWLGFAGSVVLCLISVAQFCKERRAIPAEQGTVAENVPLSPPQGIKASSSVDTGLSLTLPSSGCNAEPTNSTPLSLTLSERPEPSPSNSQSSPRVLSFFSPSSSLGVLGSALNASPHDPRMGVEVSMASFSNAIVVGQ